MTKKILKLSFIGIFTILILYGGVYLVAKFFPKLPIDGANNIYFYDKSGEVFSGGLKDEWVNLEDISPYLVNATLAVEDKNFYSHDGFDFLRIAKAFLTNVKEKANNQGASTITQQYARNLFLEFDKTWSRKIEEAWLTARLETHYSKDQLLEGYLNTINYGGVFGIENAAYYYFGKKANNLTLSEATILAGIPKSPTNYSPITNEENAKERQLIILNAMVKNNYISEDEKEKAISDNLVYIGKKSSDDLSTLMYYQDAVIKELKNLKVVSDSFFKTGGLKIYTNLDLEVQKSVEESIKNNLKNNEKIQTSVVVMNPSDGKVIALAGGRDHSKSQFNRAISAKRQVGSTIKPFLYYAALENGFTPSTTFTSSKTTFTFAEDKTYSPANYGDKYPDKPISLTTAITYSDNIYAVKTHLFLGENSLVEFAKRIGVSSLEPNPSAALGTDDISLMDMMKGYAAFANEGYSVVPNLITKVEDIDGKILYKRDDYTEHILNRSLTFVLNEMLSNCSSYEMVDYGSPTCLSIAPKLKHKYAIKTGTTDTDHLIFGYNKDLIVGVWSGYDDNLPTTPLDGSNMKNMWADIMENYFKDKESTWYNIPKNVVGVLVNPITGELAKNEDKNKKILYYIKGTEPEASYDSLENSIPTIKTE